MTTYKIDVVKLDNIVKKAIEVINNSKTEIYDIAGSARKECKRLEEELRLLKCKVSELFLTVEKLEEEVKNSKNILMKVNQNFSKYTQEELKEAYEKADNLRVMLAVKREQEQNCILQRNDLELRIKESYKTLQKADSLITQVGAALGYLSGDLLEMIDHLDGMQKRHLLGLKIIKAQEEERQRVARDIHDGPAQLMSNVVLKAEICERMIDVDLEKAKEELQNLKKIVRDSLQDVRKIIYNLRPMSLDDLGLVPTLQRYISTFQQDSGVIVTFKTRGAFDDIKPMISLAVFRIVQEAINNIAKHSSACNASVSLEIFGNELRLYINDDGKGFDMNLLKASGDDISSGFGLFSMKERIDLLGGNLGVSSEPGKGTRLDIAIPFVQKEGDINE